MAKLIDMLQTDSPSTRSGQVRRRLADGRYQIRAGNRVITARSGVGALTPGMAVILARTAECWAVVGLERSTGRGVTEVQVEG